MFGPERRPRSGQSVKHEAGDRQAEELPARWLLDRGSREASAESFALDEPLRVPDHIPEGVEQGAADRIPALHPTGVVRFVDGELDGPHAATLFDAPAHPQL